MIKEKVNRIIMTFDEFEDLIHKICKTEDESYCDYDIDEGLWYSAEEMSREEINSEIEKYFNIKINRIYGRHYIQEFDCDVNVYIEYEEEFNNAI